MNLGPITDAINALSAAADSFRAVKERNAKDAVNLQAAQDILAASTQELDPAKAAFVAALDQYGAVSAQFVTDAKVSIG